MPQFAPPDRERLAAYAAAWALFCKLTDDLAVATPKMYRRPGEVRDALAKLSDLADQLDDEFRWIDSRTDN